MSVRLGLSAAVLLAAISAGTAQAADLIVDDVAIDAAVPSGDWSGAYVGGHVGFLTGTVDWDMVLPVPTPGESYDTDGWLLGAQMGYNWQSGSLVYGLEGSVSLHDSGGEFVPGISSRTNWSASLVGRVGYALDSVLLYGLAGITVANATGDLTIIDNTQTHVGGILGAGVEALVADGVSVKAEYNLSLYGTATYDYVPDTLEVDGSYTTHTFKAGVNFHF